MDFWDARLTMWPVIITVVVIVPLLVYAWIHVRQR